jgi:thioredoxin 1
MSVQKITANEFESLVLKADGPVLVDFFAEWCGPCKTMARVIEEVSAEKPDAKIYKIDVDESGEIAESYGVASIPTFILFKNGEVAEKRVGTMPKGEVLKLI